MDIIVEYWNGKCWKLLDLLDEGDCVSHSFTIVILPKKDNPLELSIESEVSKLLAPFSEELELPVWWAKCWCVGRYAELEVSKQLDAEFGTIDSVRDKFHLGNKEIYAEQQKLLLEGLDRKNNEKIERLAELEDRCDKLWEEALASRKEREVELMLAHPKSKSPKSDCSHCFGTGEFETTSNYSAKWDWWRIGGRWDGEIKGERITDEEDKGFNFGFQHESLERNTSLTDFLFKNKIIPFAILTPDGVWHEKGNMGWWGIVVDKKEQKLWDEEALDIYKLWEGHIAVGCDLHI
jgi:hypothetical protein